MEKNHKNAEVRYTARTRNGQNACVHDKAEGSSTGREKKRSIVSRRNIIFQAGRLQGLRKRRVYTTRRIVQFNVKVTAETVERFYKLAGARQVPLFDLLEQALDALERVGET